MLYFIIFFVVDFSLGRTPPDPRRAEERWLDQCRLYAGTWQRSWTGIWLSAKSPWTAAVHRQRMMFIWMVSMIISPEKKNSWHYCPEDNSEGRWHLRMFFVENKVPFEKLASQTMMGQHADFIALCRGDTHFSKCLRYHWIIHQQTKCSKVTGFDHVVSQGIQCAVGGAGGSAGDEFAVFFLSLFVWN